MSTMVSLPFLHQKWEILKHINESFHTLSCVRDKTTFLIELMHQESGSSCGDSATSTCQLKLFEESGHVDFKALGVFPTKLDEGDYS